MFLFPVRLFIHLSALECYNSILGAVISLYLQKEKAEKVSRLMCYKKIKHKSLRYYFNLVKFVAKEGS